jgi:hypothetical protein
VRRLAWLLVLGVASCDGTVDRPPPPPVPAASPAPPPRPVAQVHALLLNGGGSKSQNFRSHLLHVEQLFAQLEAAGIDRSRIDVFSADGENPDPDVALRDAVPSDDFWLVDGTRLELPLRPAVEYGDTRVGDAPVRPATKAALAAWFDDEGRRLGPGDLLLLYVTDHGTKNADDTANNRIVLWGKDENLSVQELSALVSRLDPGVRVVTVMSQCYSGAFANLAAASAGSTARRERLRLLRIDGRPSAYGCYPENRGREKSALVPLPRACHHRPAKPPMTGVVADATPDVPLRSSDVYLGDLVRHAAEAEGAALATVVDGLLDTAWRDRAAWEPDIGRLDRIGAAFGIFSPRSLRELDEESQRIDAMVEQLKTHGNAWRNAQESLARANLDRLPPRRMDRAPPRGRTHGKAASRSTRSPPSCCPRCARPSRRTDDERALDAPPERRAREAIGRMEVRQGVVPDARSCSRSPAASTGDCARGRVCHVRALRACDASRSPTPAARHRAAAGRSRARRRRARRQRPPAWTASSSGRHANERKLADGRRACSWCTTTAGGKAGVREGDVILGPPGAPFVEKEQIREWAMRSAPGVEASLKLLRDGATQVVALVPQSMPQKWPSLPGPPKVGSTAPPLRLGTYRGDVPVTLADDRPGSSSSGPPGASAGGRARLMAFEATRGTEVVTITDETATELDPFFAEWKDPFPARRDRRSRGAFGLRVSGTPVRPRRQQRRRPAAPSCTRPEGPPIAAGAGRRQRRSPASP